MNRIMKSSIRLIILAVSILVFFGCKKDDVSDIRQLNGRFPGQGEGASIEECSKICKFLGLKDAINLDGGGSSSLWTPSTGVINHPCDNKKWTHDGERKDPTIFVAK